MCHDGKLIRSFLKERDASAETAHCYSFCPYSTVRSLKSWNLDSISKSEIRSPLPHHAPHKSFVKSKNNTVPNTFCFISCISAFSLIFVWLIGSQQTNKSRINSLLFVLGGPSSPSRYSKPPTIN